MNTNTLNPLISGLYFSDQLVKADIDDVKGLVKQAGVFNAEEIQIAGELLEERITGKDDSYQFILIKDKNNRLQGYSCFGEIPFTDKRFDLYWIVVAKKFHGTGLAKILLDKTEKSIFQQGGKIVYAETSGTLEYTPARTFYLKNEFELIATFPDFYQEKNDKLVFSKKLFI